MAAFISRAAQLRRLAKPSTWRFLALLLTDPRWKPLFDSLAVNSLEKRFADPVPWLAWHSLALLEEEVGKRCGGRVLEWGSGASTLWYFLHGVRPTAIEHDVAWFEACQKYLGGKADLRLVPVGDDYCRPAVNLAEFSVIVIDGRERVACGRYIYEGIKHGTVVKGTLVVFDDSNRDRYRPVLRDLESTCSRHQSFSGPTSVEIDKMTTFFWV